MACHTLTKREREVLALVAQGKRNRQIAQALTITEGTVEVHLHNIFGKLDVSTRTQAALFYTLSLHVAPVAARAGGTSGAANPVAGGERILAEIDNRRAVLEWAA